MKSLIVLFGPNGVAEQRPPGRKDLSGQVKIATSVNPLDHRPGDKATLTFELTDEQGKPKPGAFGGKAGPNREPVSIKIVWAA